MLRKAVAAGFAGVALVTWCNLPTAHADPTPPTQDDTDGLPGTGIPPHTLGNPAHACIAYYAGDPWYAPYYSCTLGYQGMYGRGEMGYKVGRMGGLPPLSAADIGEQACANGLKDIQSDPPDRLPKPNAQTYLIGCRGALADLEQAGFLRP